MANRPPLIRSLLALKNSQRRSTRAESPISMPRPHWLPALIYQHGIRMQRINQQLREALDEILDRYTCDDVGTEGIQQIKNLAETYSHSITLVDEAIPGKPET